MQTIDQTIKKDLSRNFKVGDKVRVLRNDDPEEESPKWKTFYFGIIIQMGNKFARIWDWKESDSNTGLLTDSTEWISFECKMFKIIKD